MTDPLIERAERHLAADHARDQKLDRAQRFADALARDNDEVRRAVAAELIEIVGTPA